MNEYNDSEEHIAHHPNQRIRFEEQGDIQEKL
jgi:hypothetical protein